MTNSTFNTIISTPITYKKKGADGKYIAMTTTALEDNFAHAPKLSDIEDESAKSALGNLVKVFEYLETAATSRTDNQRDKSVNKAHDFARSYLKAVGLGCGVGNIAMLTALFAPKRQTKTDKDTKEKVSLAVTLPSLHLSNMLSTLLIMFSTTEHGVTLSLPVRQASPKWTILQSRCVRTRRHTRLKRLRMSRTKPWLRLL